MLTDHHTQQQMGSLDCSESCRLESLGSYSSWDVCCLVPPDKKHTCSRDTSEAGRGMEVSNSHQLRGPLLLPTQRFWWCLMPEDPRLGCPEWVWTLTLAAFRDIWQVKLQFSHLIANISPGQIFCFEKTKHGWFFHHSKLYLVKKPVSLTSCRRLAAISDISCISCYWGLTLDFKPKK